MKKFESICLLFIILFAYVGFLFFADSIPVWKDSSSTYPALMVVDTIDKHFKHIIIQDISGNLWEFDGAIEDWEIGDLCALIMDDNGTPENRFDDKIISVRYGGRPEWFVR